LQAASMRAEMAAVITIRVFMFVSIPGALDPPYTLPK